MPRITIESTETQSFEPIPAGRYGVRIDDVRWETAKTSGNQQMRTVMTIITGAQEGRTLNDWITHTPATGWKFEQLLKAALDPDDYEVTETGKTTEKGRPILSFDFDSDDLIGCDMVVQVTIEDDRNGTPRNRVRYLAAPTTKAAVVEQPEVDDEPDAADVEEEPVAPKPKTRRRRTLQA